VAVVGKWHVSLFSPADGLMPWVDHVSFRLLWSGSGLKFA
jgi:hypothetical protein